MSYLFENISEDMISMNLQWFYFWIQDFCWNENIEKINLLKDVW